ncbi:protein MICRORCHIDIA 5-like [Lycium ferocissimum]|uniref:protein MICRORCHIDIA 5-like n=1 Tax=Lycium ferocissimum TaxID=112874 RepID=UPI002814B7FE|nr:protein MICRORCHIDIA 5-like [Lycium ferocissimum]
MQNITLYKNRLIKPFWRVWNAAGSDGRGVIGALEANFVYPAHDKQGFERTIVLASLEARLQVMQKKYWSSNCHFIGYAKRRNVKNSIVSPDEKKPNACSVLKINSCSLFSSNVGPTNSGVECKTGLIHSSINEGQLGAGSIPRLRRVLESAAPRSFFNTSKTSNHV